MCLVSPCVGLLGAHTFGWKAAALHGLLSLVNAGVRAGLAPTMTDNFLHQSASVALALPALYLVRLATDWAQLLRADGERLAEELRSSGKAAMGIPVQAAPPFGCEMAPSSASTFSAV